MVLMRGMFNDISHEKARVYITPSEFSDTSGVGRATQQNYKSYLKQYTNAAWVFTCIQRIASQGAGVPLKLYKKVVRGDKVEYTEVGSHPILQLLKKVNPFLTGPDLVEITLSYEELTGNAYWLLDMFENGKPTELHPLRPDRVTVIPDKKNYIKEYKYKIGSSQYLTLKPEQIIHFKYFNSLDDYYGLSPLSAGRMAVDTQRLGDEYNKNFYANSAQPRGALISKEGITSDNKKRIAAAWRQMHQGTRNAHKVAILEGGLDWKALGISQKDMDFIAQKKMTREDIMGVFGVPPAMIGIFEFANYANSREQREIFWRNTMVPKLNKYTATVNEFLVKPWDEALEIRFDYSIIDALQADAQVRATTDEVLTRSGIKTINEAREDRGLAPVSWGDQWMAPLNLAPISSRSSSGENGNREPNEEQHIIDVHDEEGRIKKECEEAAKIKAQKFVVQQTINNSESVDLKEEQVQEIIAHGEPIRPDQLGEIINEVDEEKKKIRTEKWILYKNLTEIWEKKFIPFLQKEFKVQLDETLINLEDTGFKRAANDTIQKKDADDELIDRILFNKKEADKALRKGGKPLTKGALEANANKEISALGLNIVFDLENPAVREWIDKKVFKFAHEVNKTTHESLRKELKVAIKEGEGIRDAEKRIALVFDTSSKARARMIARTEIISATNAGAMEAYKQSGVVKKTEWITSRDADVRGMKQGDQFSHLIDGETVKLGELYSTGLAFPGDPIGEAGNIINCRCTQSGVVEE